MQAIHHKIAGGVGSAGRHCSCCKISVSPGKDDASQCRSPSLGAGEAQEQETLHAALPDVKSSKDSGEPQLWFTTPTLGPTTNVVLSCSWNDQGWGNQKGCLYARLAGATSWTILTPKPAPHEATKMQLRIPTDVFTVAEYSPPLRLELGYRVGGGGGHALTVVGAKLTVSFDLCCVCALDLGYECTMCGTCDRSWKHLRALETVALAESSNPAAFLAEVNSSRRVIGPSLQHRVDLMIVNTLLQSDAGADSFVDLVRQGALQSVCRRASETSSILAGEDGKLDLSVSKAAHEASRKERDKSQPVLCSRITIPAHLRMRSVAKAEALLALVPGKNLTALNVSRNRRLEHLPVQELVSIESLTSIECYGCARLYSPPPEIADMGGMAVVVYLKSANSSGIFNTNIELIAVGNGESGKTSVLRAVTNGKAEKIHEDKRTVGITMNSWDLSEEAGVTFHIKDLAGQAVYTLTNQFFLVQRAIYMLVWRVDKGKSSDMESWEVGISEMVLTWMESLQLRVPGASILLVVTHIDCVSAHEVHRQVKYVQTLVETKLQEFRNDDPDDSTVPLTVWNEGRSFPVNCLDGDGVQALKQGLIRMAHALPWYREAIPKFIMQFEEELKKNEAKGLIWLPWTSYSKIASSLETSSSVQALLEDAKMKEYVWGSRVRGELIDVSADGMTATDIAKDPKKGDHVGGRYRVIAAETGYQSARHAWQVRVLRRGRFCIGVATSAVQSDWHEGNGRALHQLDCAWTICVPTKPGDGINRWHMGRSYKTGLIAEAHEGDLIGILLDCDEHTVAFTVNGNHGDNASFSGLPEEALFPVVNFGGDDSAGCSVRIEIESGDKPSSLQAFGTQANVAVGKPVSLANLPTAFDRDVCRLVDGRIESHNDHWGTQSCGPGSITIDLQAPHIISSVTIYWSGGWGAGTTFGIRLLSYDDSVLCTPVEKRRGCNVIRDPWGPDAMDNVSFDQPLEAWKVCLDLQKPRGGIAIAQILVHGEQAQDVKFDSNMIRIATKFLHDKATIKYFGDVSTFPKLKLIDRTVFIDSKWIIDVLKGLIRHDRNVLMTFFGQREDEQTRKLWLRRVQRLATYGVLHQDLIPFLWPGGTLGLSTVFWKWARSQEEGELWSRDVASSEEDYARVLTLLEGCDILHRISEKEFAVPALLADTKNKRLDARAFSQDDCTVAKMFCFAHVPSGFFERLIVKCRKSYSHMDFNADSAALYWRGLKAQLFMYRSQVAHDGGGGGNSGGNVIGGGGQARRSIVVLKILTSTRAQMMGIEANIEVLLTFFSGMRCLDNEILCEVTSELQTRIVTEPIQVRFVEAVAGLEARLAIPAGVQHHYSVEKLTVRIAKVLDISSDDVTVTVIGNLLKNDQDVQDDKTQQCKDQYLTIRVDTLKQPPPTLETLNAELRRIHQEENLSGNPVLAELEDWKPVYCGEIKKAIENADALASADDEEHQVLTVDVGADSPDTRRLRVVLVCMDKYIARSAGALAQFRAAIAERLVVVPLICPGYAIDDYSNWWPKEKEWQAMKNHALFVDLRRMKESPDALRDKVSHELLPQILKFLEEWRGQAPDPSAFAQASDRIPCIQCSESSLTEPHTFSRSECMAKLHAWRAEENQARAVCGKEEGQGHGSGEICEEQLSAVHQERQSRDAIQPTETCRHGHTSRIEDILSHNVIYSAVPCPCCVQNGQIPPFCFNRASCLLFFSEDTLEAGREGSVTCPICAEKGRAASIRILDIIVPEVFASYNWGFQLSTQKLLRPMRLRIEQEADVVMWLDVGGGMGAGQSQFTEMEEGIRKCTVVVIFISDAYCKSPNCIREFLHTTRHSKYLIPVLVPDKGRAHEQAPSSGWTGPGPENRQWWRHASQFSATDPDTNHAFSWNGLASFTPIDLRVKDSALSDEERQKEEERLLQEAELEIVKRIQSRFHRGDHIQSSLEKSYSHWRKAALLESFTADTDNLEQMKEEAEQLFSSIDTNGDGIINESELLTGFPQLNRNTAHLLLAEADANEDGGISFEEFWCIIQSVAEVSGKRGRHEEPTSDQRSSTLPCTSPMALHSGTGPIRRETPSTDDIPADRNAVVAGDHEYSAGSTAARPVASSSQRQPGAAATPADTFTTAVPATDTRRAPSGPAQASPGNEHAMSACCIVC